MAVGKTEGGSFVGRAVQWAKDVGEKIKAAVAEYTSGSGYAKAEKPTVQPHDAAASNARAATKFADKPQAFLAQAKFVEIKPLSDEELMAMKKPVGMYIETHRVLGDKPASLQDRLPAKYRGGIEYIYDKQLGDDKMRALLLEAMKDPEVSAKIKADIQKIIDRLDQLPR